MCDQVLPGDGQRRVQHHYGRRDGGGGHARRCLCHQGDAIANGGDDTTMRECVRGSEREGEDVVW
jgi:hypothetical protein